MQGNFHEDIFLQLKQRQKNIINDMSLIVKIAVKTRHFSSCFFKSQMSLSFREIFIKKT